MQIDLEKYQAFVFDCDGVVLNSNTIKTQAFYNVANIYGNKAAKALVDYHVQNGGISRYKKFEYFLTQILSKPLIQDELNELLENFANEVKKALLTCEVAESLQEIKEKTKYAKWFIVSGGDQNELREVFEKRGLAELFDGGIFGSPDTKDTILKREKENQNIKGKALFLGDSIYDYTAASKAEMDFVFISGWSEVENWEDFCIQNKIKYETAIKSILIKRKVN